MKNTDTQRAEVAQPRIVRLFVVLYDDGGGLQCPMMMDADCEGALTAWWHPNKIATFASRQEARSAINVSTKFAQLCKAQGKPENTDFTEFKRHLRIQELSQPYQRQRSPTPALGGTDATRRTIK